MAVSELVRLSEDKVIRQAYQRRQDDIMLASKRAKEYKEMKRKAEQAQRRAEQAEAEVADQAKIVAEQAKLIAELKTKLGSK